MTTAEMVTELKEDYLNRPGTDSMFTDPDDFEWALSKAHRKLREKIVDHYPDLLYETATVSADDSSGETYTLDDDHMGELEVWEPPGPPNGFRLYPVLPESYNIGFWVEGRVINLTKSKVYSPGLYVRWIPAATDDLKSTATVVNSSLPVYCDDYIISMAAYYLARRPGSMLNAGVFKQEAQEEWRGDPADPSDLGLVGKLKRMYVDRGYETVHGDAAPWYKFRGV